jgi:hypothetical protein
VIVFVTGAAKSSIGFAGGLAPGVTAEVGNAT